MGEYIEREKYVKLNDIIETLEHEWGYKGMREDLYNLPTADVAEVVRCKDCKNRYVPCRCALWYGTVNETEYFIGRGDDFFCSYAEKKEGAENDL